MQDYEVLILLVGVLSIFLGLAVIVMPRILPYLVGVYLMVSGVFWVARAFL